jgi:hypothetical protein
MIQIISRVFIVIHLSADTEQTGPYPRLSLTRSFTIINYIDSNDSFVAKSVHHLLPFSFPHISGGIPNSYNSPQIFDMEGRPLLLAVAPHNAFTLKQPQFPVDFNVGNKLSNTALIDTNRSRRHNCFFTPLTPLFSTIRPTLHRRF